MPEQPTRREQARRDHAAMHDGRWSTNTVAGFTTRSRADDTRPRGDMPPQWVLDFIADEALWKGYRSHATCPTCFTRVSLTGTCFCE